MTRTASPERKKARSGGDAQGPSGFPVIGPIIGIGASTGEQRALEDFFSGLAEGMVKATTIIIVQNPGSGLEGLPLVLVQSWTWMRVLEVEDGMTVLPDHVYVAPAEKEIALGQGLLRLSDFLEPHGFRHPIDSFLRSLAVELGPESIGIILPGCASDGIVGAGAIKEAGGWVICQNSGSPHFRDEPSGIEAEGADHKLEPAQMPAFCVNLLSRRQISLTAEDRVAIRKIFRRLRTSTGYDFARYKQEVIRRVLERRMGETLIPSLGDYAIHLQKSPTELDCLFHQFSAGVTWFFRDPEAFEALAEIVAKNMDHHMVEEPIRVWVAGCSTGEEAYSMAILLTELLEALKLKCDFQVFATDIDANALAKARDGVYQGDIPAFISAERLARFFTLLPCGGYRINDSIRDVVVFSLHSLINDPPFSKLDLITCRNLLIYLDARAQKQILSLFHQSLVPFGLLMLGTAENTGDQQGNFVSLDRKARIYQRQEIQTGKDPAEIRNLAVRAVSGAGDASGEPRLETPKRRGAAPMSRIVDRPAAATSPRQLPAHDLEMSGMAGRLRISNEEAICSNEEHQHVNQELQSARKELEISKDQLQTSNEELASLNAGLQVKMSDLAMSKDDLLDFLESAGIGTVFVDFQLRIVGFNPMISRILNLIPSDVGQPLAQISVNFSDHMDLSVEVGLVLQSMIGNAQEVMTQNGLLFLMRIHPYRTLDGLIEVALVSFTEISRKLADPETLKTADSLHRLAVIARDASDGIVMHDPDGRILAWNSGAARMYGWSEDEALRMNLRAIIPADLQGLELEALSKLGRAKIFEPYFTRRLDKSGSLMTVCLIATAMINEAAEVYAIATTERSMTLEKP